MKNILTIIKKELRRVFTDRRMLITLILPGLLIYIIYSFLGDGMMSSFLPNSDYEYLVYVMNQPEEFESFATTDSLKITLKTPGDLSLEEIKEQIKKQEADLLIIYEENFLEKVNQYEISSGMAAPQIEMYYNSASTESSMIYSYYTEILNRYEESISNKFDINFDQNIQFDLATVEDISVSIIKMLFPFLIIIFLFTGCMAIAPESIAGEKDRGTIATLLVTPIRRSQLAIGKIVSLSIISLISALSSFLGIIFSLPKLLQGMDVSISIYGFKEYVGILLIILSTVLLFVVALSIISAFAKSIKEANTYAMPLMIISMLIGVLSMFAPAQASSGLFIIPIYNSVLCLSELFSLEFYGLHIFLCVIFNLIYACLGVFVLAKMFNSEKIMFNK